MTKGVSLLSLSTLSRRRGHRPNLERQRLRLLAKQAPGKRDQAPPKSDPDSKKPEKEESKRAEKHQSMLGASGKLLPYFVLPIFKNAKAKARAMKKLKIRERVLERQRFVTGKV